MKTYLLFALVSAVAASSVARAQISVGTPPAGCVRLNAGGARDNWLSLPLVRRTELTRRVSAVAPATLSLSGASLSVNAYAPTSAGAYYVQFANGNLAGVAYKILSNTTTAVTVETLGDDLSAHPLGAITAGASGDLVRIRPYWTVSDVFGGTSGTPLLDPAPALSGAIYTEADALLFPDNLSVGTEKTPLAVIAYVTGQGWRRQGAGLTDSSGTAFPAGVPCILRRQSSTALSTYLVGYVAQEPGAIRFPALSASDETDVSIALFHPSPTRMADLGLASVMESSLDAASARDLVLIPSDVRNGFSVPPARHLHLIGPNWFEGEDAADNATLRFGTGLVIRLRGERPVRYWRQAAPN
jgi:uncharacterized protein (TIGR02597 family)